MTCNGLSITGNGQGRLVATCAAVMLLLSGCHPCAKRLGPVHAIWVTRFDYKTADDVVRIIDQCADAGFNSVLFQVRGNATALYASPHEPWAEELGGAYPGFDPLALACRRAHQRHVRLHAWVNVLPAWRGKQPPEHPEQLYHQHPEWFWYDQHGQRQPLTSFYVSLNPCLPEVRAYLVEVFRDLVSRYDVDGLHMDYIRFPNEPPATPPGSGLDYPRDPRTLELFAKETGLKPDEDPPAWDRWRTEQVTRLVADIHDMIRRTKPAAVLSAAVGAVRANALTHFQDAQRWTANGIIDVVYLMNYTDNPELFEQRLEPWLEDPHGVGVVPGLWFGSTDNRSAAEGLPAVRRQIEIAHEKTGSFCVFAYSSLFDSPGERGKVEDEAQHHVRELRRRELIPFIRSLGGAGPALRVAK
ncbi:MAG: family 10 glycosylhydrolase [Planctomycetota bacterium]